MVIRVQYYIPKEYFQKNKTAIKKILRKGSFEICVQKFEKQFTDKKIAKNFNLTVFFIRKILSNACANIRASDLKKPLLDQAE